MTEWTPEQARKLADEDHLRHTHGDVWEVVHDLADALESTRAQIAQQQAELAAARPLIEAANRVSGALNEVYQRNTVVNERLRDYYDAARAGEDGNKTESSQ